MEGGVESGFNHVKPTEYKPRLLHLKGRKNVRVVEVPLAGSSLNEGDVYVLDAGLSIWQWQGKKSNQAEKLRAAQLTSQLVSERRGLPKHSVINQTDKDANEDFWTLLGGRVEPGHDDGGDDDWETKTDKLLYQLSDAGGKLEFNKIAEASRVTKDKLDTKDVFVLDIGIEIFVWIGKGASAAEKKEAMVVGTKYLAEHKRPNWLPITRIPEGAESSYFYDQFAGAAGFTVKRATPAPAAGSSYGSGGASGGGCFLSYVEASNGSLIITWSKTPVAGALASFQAGKTVADHKYKTNSGREELTRGTDSTPKNAYQGWCNFLKLAREYNGTITVYTKDVQVSVHDDSNKIIMIGVGEAFEVHSQQQPAVGAWQRSKALFEGAQSTGRDHFINTAQAAGAALVLPKK